MILVLVNVVLAASPVTPAVTRTCGSAAASSSATVAWEVLAQKGSDAAEDAKDGGPSVTSSLKRSWGWEKSLDLCPADDPAGGLLIPGDRLYEVELPEPGKPRSCVTLARGSLDGTAEGAAESEDTVMHAVAAGRSGVAVTASNVTELTTSWTGGGRTVASWGWKTGSRTTSLLRATIRVEGASTAGGSVEVPGLARLTLWGGTVEGQVRKRDRWETVSAPPPLELVAEAVVVGGKGNTCASLDASAVSKGGRFTARDTAAARVDVRIEALPEEAYPALAPGGPEFTGCACP